MEKRELIRKVKGMTDLSAEEKSYLIELINNKKKYGLVWEDKPEDVEEQLRSMLPILIEDKKKAIISDDKEAPNHILIEGDNLHALTALSFSHKGKIDVIYIDPPYNTGNKDFIYNDRYVDQEDSYRHSKWLSFMEKRLRIAQELLSDTGVMFISIDDNEVAQLKLLCDEVFCEKNFIAQFLWEKTSTPPALSKKVRKKFEYVLCYEKNRDNKSFSIGMVDGGDVPLLNTGNKERLLTFPPYSIKFNIPDGLYQNDIKRKITIISDNLVVENSLNKNSVTFKGEFKWKQKMLNEEISKGTFFIVKSNLFSIRFQRLEKYLKTKTPTNILSKDLGVGTNEDAKKELEKVNINSFDYPKPISLLCVLLNLKLESKAVILDFFAGSGTTLHATMELNKEDGGKRQCILVTNNENKIAEEVTYERNRRVIQGYTNAKGEEVEGLSKNNLRYYKADFVPSEQTEQNRRRLTKYSTELICIKEDCYTEITEQYQSEFIQTPLVRIFTNNLGKHLILIYHSHFQYEVIEELIGLIPQLDSKEKVKIYSFSPEKETIEEEFRAISDQIDAVALPDSIYNAYKQCFRTIDLHKNQSIISPQSTEE